MPDYATHYHRADCPPFRNLSDLNDDDLQAVLNELNTPRSPVQSARRFGPRYMALRRATEEKAGQLFRDAGGHPVRTSPHYFVLGSSTWFAGLYAAPAEIRLSLHDLPPEVTRATWSDSIDALRLGVPLGLPAPDPVHADRVHRLDQLPDLVRENGLPEGTAPDAVDGYAGHEWTTVDAYIEIQLWADDPIQQHLAWLR